MSANCPYCGAKFNWWQRAIGEAGQHINQCAKTHTSKSDISRATGCRGCPAGCFENSDAFTEIKDPSESDGKHGGHHGHHRQ